MSFFTYKAISKLGSIEETEVTFFVFSILINTINFLSLYFLGSSLSVVGLEFAQSLCSARVSPF